MIRMEESDCGVERQEVARTTVVGAERTEIQSEPLGFLSDLSWTAVAVGAILNLALSAAIYFAVSTTLPLYSPDERPSALLLVLLVFIPGLVTGIVSGIFSTRGRWEPVIIGFTSIWGALFVLSIISPATFFWTASILVTPILTALIARYRSVRGFDSTLNLGFAILVILSAFAPLSAWILDHSSVLESLYSMGGTLLTYVPIVLIWRWLLRSVFNESIQGWRLSCLYLVGVMLMYLSFGIIYMFAGYYSYLVIGGSVVLAINACTLQIGVEVAKLFRRVACR